MNKTNKIHSEIELALLCKKEKLAQKKINEISDADIRHYWQMLFSIRFRTSDSISLYQEIVQKKQRSNLQKYILSLANVIIYLRQKPIVFKEENKGQFEIIEGFRNISVYGCYLVAYYHWKIGELKKVFRDYKKMIEIVPDNGNVCYFVASSLFSIHQKQEALNYLRRTRFSIRKCLYYLASFYMPYKYGKLIVFLIIAFIVFAVVSPIDLAIAFIFLIISLYLSLYHDPLANMLYIPLTGATCLEIILKNLINIVGYKGF
jgi:tetratricopeptide (TPR) repeat protein